jgi:hypothetical protein
MLLLINNECDYPKAFAVLLGSYIFDIAGEGNEYSELPRTVIVRINDFKSFDCVAFHSEYQALEVTRHTQLTDRMSLHYFELPKLPVLVSVEDVLELWLTLFNAETEEDISKIEVLEVAIMKQAITAYRSITAAP